ncbi:MFS transporter [Rhodococcus sp. HNM0569]|uniref:MFS transporter n=1 Tax=Rhodococcus sp. HNM0569 TaxID=2716340 RepID=UPI00146F7AFC|nr:MFS transporter [Rhodococcus sp. HNM0569]NLU81955.1 MFS transporter [Rhodococcus sp. HNM0569]
MICAVKVLHGRLLVFAAIALSALVLRLAVTSFTPVAARVRDEFGFSETIVGVFGMIPTAMFALFGLTAPILTRRLGLEWTAFVAMLAAGIGMLVRATVSATPALLVFSALALGGMGIGNVVVPPLVKKYFPDRLAAMSTVYIVGVQVGTIVPAFAAVPVADLAGWRVSIGMWALVAFAAALPWLVQLVRLRGENRTGGADAGRVADDAPAIERGRVWRSPVGIALALMFGGTSLTTYAMFTWIPDILTDAGRSPAYAGSMVGVFSAMGLVAAIAAPSACARMRNPYPIVIAASVCFLVAFAGLLFAPTTATILWIVLLGLGPSTFPMSLTLINLRTRTHVGSSELSGFAQGVGYTIASTGPLLFGVLHSVTDGWWASFGFLTAAVVVVLVSGAVACRNRMLEDTWLPRGRSHTTVEDGVRIS